MTTAGAFIGIIGLLVIAYGGASVCKAERPSRMRRPQNAPVLRRLGERIAGLGLAIAIVGVALLTLGSIAK
jgi:hypothetical protein